MPGRAFDALANDLLNNNGMNKIAIFGKPGSGKSTLAKNISRTTGIPLHPLDSIVYKANGEFVDRDTYDKEHQSILSSENWIIDGFGPIDSFYQRLEAADTLIYIDLPYVVSYWLVTKRLAKGVFTTPEGWPAGSSILKGSTASYKALKQSPKFWNDQFLNRLEDIAKDKSLHIIRSVAELNSFANKEILGK